MKMRTMNRSHLKLFFFFFKLFLVWAFELSKERWVPRSVWDPSTPSAAAIRFTDHAHRGCCSHLERLCFRVGGYDKEVVAGREKKKVYLCMTGSLFCTGEFNTILQINSNTKKKRYPEKETKEPPTPCPHSVAEGWSGCNFSS